MNNPSPFVVAPTALVEARLLSHLACQWPSKAARANLAAESDDSHSNLGWSPQHHALTSRGLHSTRPIQLGFSFSNQALIWLVDNTIEDTCELTNHASEAVDTWVDNHLQRAGLRSIANAEMPYTLDTAFDQHRFKQVARETDALGAWYAYGQDALETLVAQNPVAVSNPTVRCWPHHFDLGALFALETGDPETARSIGVGLSPGDGSYAEPYFYCSPWPVPDVTKLPKLTNPVRWHTQGFVSAVVCARDLEEASDIHSLLSVAFATALQVVKS